LKVKLVEQRSGARCFFIAAAAVTAALGLPLYELVRLSLKSELHSHLLLIPVVSWYVWKFLDGKTSASTTRSSNRLSFGAVLAGALGLAAMAGYLYLRVSRRLPVTEYLWAGVLGYLLMLLALALRTVGWGRLKQHQFAIWFLAFFIPLPLAVTDGMSVALQHGSAEATDWLLQLTGLPFLREGLRFQLPRLVILVAEECSGVRSTLVLVITSLIAGKMFLQTGWKRAVLALLTIPLGLLRNAARITLLAWLSVNVDAGIIHGPLHERGGPIFFALSLVPLFGLLWYFKRSESSKTTAKNQLGES
jgi:exosortase C (VPDSG-CTERM-specific)